MSTTPAGGFVARGAPALTPVQLDTLRGMLEQQRNFRLDQLQQLRRSDELGLLAEVERDINASLAHAARSALRDVLLALRRMDDGVYGQCRECADRLPVERLEVLPQVTLCMPCQRGAESR